MLIEYRERDVGRHNTAEEKTPKKIITLPLQRYILLLLVDHNLKTLVPPKAQPPASRLVWGLESIAKQSQLLHIRRQRGIFGTEQFIDTGLQTLQWLARRRLAGLLVWPWARSGPCAECGGGGLVRWWSWEQRGGIREIGCCHSHSNSSLLSETVPGSRIAGMGNSNFHFEGKFEASKNVCGYHNVKRKSLKEIGDLC